MLELLILSLITSLFIQGLNYATTYSPNFIFEGTEQPLKRVEHKPFDYEIFGLLKWSVRCVLIKVFPNKADYLIKPIFGCPVCMSSVWGTLFYWSYHLSSHEITNSKIMVIWGVFLVVTAGMSRLINSLINR